ncbi:MAG TPA: ABC transporter permease [Longimicrobiales bacterium]
MGTLVKDFRYAARTLGRSPGFTMAVVATLALGIGANTAVFSVVNGVVLRPLPYPDPERVVYVGWNYGSSTSLSETRYKFTYIREHARVFEGVSTELPWTTELGAAEVADEVSGLRATLDFFRVVGIQPARGRSFLPEEVGPGGARVVVLSDELWRTRFDADPSILGRSVLLGGEPYTVVGVMPPGFRIPERQGTTDFIVPLPLAADLLDQGMNYTIRARVRRGVTMDQVRADLLAVTQRFRAEHPELVRDDEIGPGATLLKYSDVYVGGLERTLWVLLGAVGLVLLIGCVNVANLLLARSTARRREMAIRAAIGAGRGRIARQLLAESLLLTTVAAVVGLLVGTWSVDGLLALAPAGLPRMDEIVLDYRVLVFTFGVAAVTGTAFGLVAAWHAFRTDLNTALRDGGSRQGTSRTGARLRSAFVAAQAGLAVVLLTGAGLLIASFHRLTKVELGFQPDGVLAVQFGAMPAGYLAEGRAWEVQSRILERVRAIPGVSAAAATSIAPFSGNQLNFPMTVVGNPEATRGDVQWRSIGPDYFRTLGTAVVRGREFTEADDARATPVAIVNETFVRKYFGDQDPIGQRIDLGTYAGREVIPGFDDPERVIVGVVADTRVLALATDAEEIMYTPRAQDPRDPVLAEILGFGTLLIRTQGNAPVTPAVLAAIRQVDPRLPAPRIQPLRAAIGSSIAQERFNMVLLGSFGGLALVLTAIGIYGVVAYHVRQRTAEIGIRVALGADRARVVGMVLRQGMSPVALGLVVGLGAALALGRVIQSLLFGVTPTDPATLVTVVALIVAVATSAILLPARRAAAVDPVVALKGE